jgi:VWFA-related protein
MTAMALALFLVAQPVPTVAPGTAVRALTVSILDEQGNEVAGLVPSDVGLTENGVAREIVSFKPDRRPLSVAIIVDTSAAVGASYRLNVVPAVVNLVARLPEGTRYALWTSGERPMKLADFSDDRSAAARVLGHVAPQGGNYLLDALAEASADLKKTGREGDRTAVVAVTSTGPEFSYRDRYRAVEEAAKSGALFLAVQIDASDADFETRSNIGYTLDRLAGESGGRYEVVLSPMGLDSALRKVSNVLRAGYRISYATLADLKQRRLEITVARPKTKVLIPAGSTNAVPGS